MKTKLSLITFAGFFKIVLFSFLALSPAPYALSQIPQGFNYQAIARLTTGDPIINTTLPVRITIQADSLGTSIIWQELHSSVTTNGFGLMTLILGKGARQAVSTVATFNAIDWTVSPKFIKTEINYSGWRTMGVTRFWSVPYSKIAENLGGPVKKLAVTGTTLLNDEALFEVKNKDGNTVFAVYNEGVRVYVADGAKGLKGGFAVGGFGTDKAESQKYLVVSKDSVKIYIDTNPLTKVKKGGFAVGGYDMTKAPPQEFLRVTQDSTRIYVNNNPAKGLKGGFAVGGFDVTKGPATSFTSLTPKNYFIGHEGGQKITSGQYNSVIGYQSGKFITTGQSNAFLGYQSGYNDNTGTGNLFLGYQTGYSTTGGSYNSFVGYKSGYSNTSGVNNSFLGSFAGYSNTFGKYNTFVGDSVGYMNTIGNENSFYGDKAGFKNLDGVNNVFIGNQAGYNNIGGDSSIYIGNRSGYSNTTGNTNVFIGNRAGYSNTTASNNVFLGYQSGYLNTIAYNNVFIGNKAGYNNIGGPVGIKDGGVNNVFIGNEAGYSNTKGRENIYIGSSSGRANTTGLYNVFLGFETGFTNTVGQNNVFIGQRSGYFNTSGHNNTCVGDGTALNNTTGRNNVFLGSMAGNRNIDGWYNISIGYYAGFYNQHGQTNVFLGSQAGYNELKSNKLYIENSTADSSAALIWGDFANDILRFNNKVGIGANPKTPLAIANLPGSASGPYLRIYGADVYYASSSRDTKKDIIPLVEDFTKILRAQPVSFTDIATGERNIGYIAEDFADLGLENLVIYQNSKPISLSYELVSLYNLEIIKKQQKQIELQNERISNLEKMVEALISANKE